MEVLSTTRDLFETISGTSAVSLTQKARVRWRWRAHGDLITKKGSASASVELDGSCTIPTIRVAATTASIHSQIDVYWGNLTTDNSSTDILSPFNQTVAVDPDYDIVSLTAYEDDGLDTTLTCTITTDGVAVETATGSGPYSSCDVAHVFEFSDPIPVEP